MLRLLDDFHKDRNREHIIDGRILHRTNAACLNTRIFMKSNNVKTLVIYVGIIYGKAFLTRRSKNGKNNNFQIIKR